MTTETKKWLVTDQYETEMAIVEAETAVDACYQAHLKAWLVTVYPLDDSRQWEQIWRVKPS